MTSSFSEFSRKMRPKTLQMNGNQPSIFKSSSVPMNLQTDISPGKNPNREVKWCCGYREVKWCCGFCVYYVDYYGGIGFSVLPHFFQLRMLSYSLFGTGISIQTDYRLSRVCRPYSVFFTRC